MSGLRKLAPRSSTEQVYADLHGRIVRGELRPGDTLSEARIGESYGLSRTPVREVFWRLGEEGLLRVIPQVGTFVAPINIPAVYDSQFIRETLECRAVAEAASRARPADTHALGGLLDSQTACLDQGDFAGFFAEDERMHRLLMEIAGHPFVWPVIASAKAQLDRVRFLSLEDRAWPAMIMAQHRQLIAHVAGHEPQAAAGLMSAHLRTAFAAIGRIAEAHPEFFEGSVPPAAAAAP